MSSTYTLLCLSHDPAIEFLDGYDFQSGAGGLEKIEALALSRDPERMQGHEKCELLICRTSGAPVEFACAGGKGCRDHVQVFWQDKTWLRLLLAAHDLWDVTAAPLSEQAAALADAVVYAHRMKGCWPAPRLHKIAHMLGEPR